MTCIIIHVHALLVQGQECSNFLAGHALRSTNCFIALQEIGVMGVACWHEFPLCFINLCHAYNTVTKYNTKYNIHTE